VGTPVTPREPYNPIKTGNYTYQRHNSGVPIYAYRDSSGLNCITVDLSTTRYIVQIHYTTTCSGLDCIFLSETTLDFFTSWQSILSCNRLSCSTTIGINLDRCISGHRIPMAL
jgi:hypothetical protein